MDRCSRRRARNNGGRFRLAASASGGWCGLTGWGSRGGGFDRFMSSQLSLVAKASQGLIVVGLGRRLGFKFGLSA